jgi:hypothetical protein
MFFSKIKSEFTFFDEQKISRISREKNAGRQKNALAARATIEPGRHFLF